MLLATNEFRHCKWMCGRMSRTTHASTQLKALGLAAGHLYLKQLQRSICRSTCRPAMGLAANIAMLSRAVGGIVHRWMRRSMSTSVVQDGQMADQ